MEESIIIHNIATYREQNQQYIKLKCHFSAIFSLFGAISSHISIEGRRKSKGKKKKRKRLFQRN